MRVKYFFLFCLCGGLFVIYNELTLPFENWITEFALMPTELGLLRVPWMLGNVLLLAFGLLFGVVFLESLDEEGEPWFFKYLGRSAKA